MNDLPQRGEVRWALVPHVLEQPFRSNGWEGGLDFAGIEAIVRATPSRVELEVTVAASMRPVLILHSWLGSNHGTYGCLRTRRIETVNYATQADLQTGIHPDLYLLSGASAGKERAVLIQAVSRLHISAIGGEVIGYVSDAELREIGERLAAALDLDLDGLVQRRVEAVLTELGLG